MTLALSKMILLTRRNTVRCLDDKNARLLDVCFARLESHLSCVGCESLHVDVKILNTSLAA